MPPQGHILDANALALWRFDQGLPDQIGTTIDEQAVTWVALGGGNLRPGFCDYDPIPGAFARRFFGALTTNVSNGTGSFRTTSGAIQAAFIGSWTMEMVIRREIAHAVNSSPVFGYNGFGETLATNALGISYITASGAIQILWEYGLGLNEIFVSAADTLDIGTWTHIAISKDSGAKTIKIFKNGVAVLDTTYVNEAAGGTSGAMVLASDSAVGGQGNRANFSCRYVRLWDGGTSSGAELAANIAAMTTTGLPTQPAFQAGTGHGFDFIEAPSAVDISGNGYHLHRGYNSAFASDGGGPGGLIHTVGPSSRRILAGGFLSTWWSQPILDALENDFTLEMWVLVLSLNRGVFCIGDPGVAGDDFNFAGGVMHSDGSVRFSMEDTSQADQLVESATGLVGDHSVYHLAFRKENTNGGADWTGSLFIDGVKVKEVTGLNPFEPPTIPHFPFSLGRGGSDQPGPETEYFFDGIFGDTRFSDVARSDAEILESYTRGLPPAAGGGPISIDLITPINTISKNTPIIIDVYSGSVPLRRAWINASYAGLLVDDMVHNGDRFGSAYQGLVNVRSEISNGYRFTILRDGGWPGTPAITAHAVDTLGAGDEP